MQKAGNPPAPGKQTGLGSPLTSKPGAFAPGNRRVPCTGSEGGLRMGGGTGEGFPLGAVLPSLVPWAGGGGSSLVSLLLPQTPLAPLCQHGGAVVCLNGWVLASTRSQLFFSSSCRALVVCGRAAGETGSQQAWRLRRGPGGSCFLSGHRGSADKLLMFPVGQCFAARTQVRRALLLVGERKRTHYPAALPMRCWLQL